MERLHIRNPNFSFYCLFYPLISHIVSAHCFFQTNFSICKIEEASSVIRFFKFLKLFYCCSITVVCIFSPPLYPTPAKPTSLPCFHPSPWFYPCVLYSSSWKPFSPIALPHSPVAIVRLFLTSVSLVIFCLLFSSVDYFPVKGEIIWYLSLTAWLISLSIMLYSSICAVAKGKQNITRDTEVKNNLTKTRGE